jgi:hypothetical protein
MSHVFNKIAISVTFILLQLSVYSHDVTPQQVMNLSQLARSKSITETANAIKMGEQAVEMSRGLSDKQYTSMAYTMLVQIYMQNDDIDKAGLAVDSALWYAGQSDSRLARGMAWYRKSSLENYKGQSKEALTSAQQALKHLEGLGAINYESSLYYIIAGIYANQNDYALHKKYGVLSLITALKGKDYDNLLCAYQILGSYFQLYHTEHPDDKSSLDSALYYNRIALRTYEQHKSEMIFHSTMAIIALNTADLYAQYFPPAYRDTVFHYLDIARQIGTETHHVEVLSNVYGMMSDFESAAGHYDKAEELLLKGLAVVESDSAKNLVTKIQFMAALSNLGEKKGDYKEALKYQKQYAVLYTDLYNEEKLNITRELEAKYQAEKSAAELKSLQQTAILHKRLGYLYIGIALASVLAGFFLIRQLAMQKQEAELQARLKDEEAMRLMAEQQLLQERQERMQRDLLAGTLQVEQKTALLNTLKKKIAENVEDTTVVKQINRIIAHDKKIDESFADHKNEFEEINPAFYEQLKEKSSNSLSRLDLKHCSYIYLGLTNKEVSQKLNIAPKSILMARYRIKLKVFDGMKFVFSKRE